MAFLSRYGFYLRPGDVLYSGKNKYTFGVGHVSIVGTDGLVRHVIPYGKRTDPIDVYLRNFVRVSVLRHFDEQVAYEAAEMSELLYEEIDRYSLHPSLKNVRLNHCTKYIWQSFYYSQERDLLWNVSDAYLFIIAPYLFKYATKGSFDHVLSLR